MPKKSEPAEQKPPSSLLTLDQTAAVLALSRRSTYDKMLTGEICGVNVANGDKKPSWRITSDSVDAYLKRLIAESESRFGRAS